MDRDDVLKIVTNAIGNREPSASELNEVLTQLMGEVSLTYCRFLLEEGKTREQVNEYLKLFIPKLDAWRQETLDWIMARYNTNSTTLH